MTVTSPDESHPVTVSDPNEAHKTDLLEQFYLTLRVSYMAAPPGPGSVVHERIERLFKGAHTWANAYEIEQLLCFVVSEPQLETELQRRLAEAVALKLEYVAVMNQELQSTNPPPDKRIVLHRLLNDLQWFYSKRNQHRKASKQLMVRVSLLFMVALATFSLVLFIQFFAHGAGTAATVAAAPASTPAAPGRQNAVTGGASTTVPNTIATQPTTNQATANPAPTNGAQDKPNVTGGQK